jgi:hypothetical protein
MSECFMQSVQGKGSGKKIMQFLELIAWKVCHLNPNLGFAKNTSFESEAAVDEWVFCTIRTREGCWQIFYAVSWIDCLKGLPSKPQFGLCQKHKFDEWSCCSIRFTKSLDQRRQWVDKTTEMGGDYQHCWCGVLCWFL